MLTITKAFHDAAFYAHRSPIGAARCGETIVLSVFATESVVGGELVVYSEGFERRYPLSRDGELLRAQFKAPDARGIYYYHFLLISGAERFFVGSDKNGLDSKTFSEWPNSFRLTVFSGDFKTPDWFCDSVMYQIFPDRFARDDSNTAEIGLLTHRRMGRRVEYHEDWTTPVKWRKSDGENDYYPNDFYGGTLRGIQKKLPYLKSLGIGVIYLNPIFEADSNHRYNTADYFRIDPILGDEDDFIALCAAASELDIRILLDGVFSHTGADSVYFNKAGHYPSIGAYQGMGSPYYKWFDFKKFPDDYRCWWGFKSLPEVNEDNPDWQNFIYRGKDSVIKHWLRIGAFGYRLDVADELPDGCLRGIYKSAKDENPDAVIVGEVWEDPTVKYSYGKLREYALGDALDSVMNYPLRTALIEFARGKVDATALLEFLLRQKLHYPQPMYMALMNLLSSHDVPRIRTELGASDPSALASDRQIQAGLSLTSSEDGYAAKLQTVLAAIQFSLPGVPCIYYGDELGMSGARDPFNRAPFSSAGVDLSDMYRNLSTARSRSIALSRGDAGFFAPNADTICILRVADGQAVLTSATRASSDIRLDFSLERNFRGLSENAAKLVKEKTVSVIIPAVGFTQFEL